MLEGIKRWLGGKTAPASQAATPVDLASFADWSRRGAVRIRSPRETEGVIIEGRAGEWPWRLEWGASQRPYVLGRELRIRCAPRLPADLQAIVLNRPLQEAIEKTLFEQYVEGVQTRIDTETPAEMRWLVMYPNLSRAELGSLQERYAATANHKPWLLNWLSAGLGQGLLGLHAPASTAFVLMVNRGKMTLRTELDEALPRTFEPYLRLFETALREAPDALVDPEVS